MKTIWLCIAAFFVFLVVNLNLQQGGFLLYGEARSPILPSYIVILARPEQSSVWRNKVGNYRPNTATNAVQIAIT